MALERVFEASWTLHDLRRPPLGSFPDDFCDWLLAHGFTWYTVRTHLGRVLHLNRWLAECGWCGGKRLSRNEVESFLAVYPERCRCRGVMEEHLKRMRHSLGRFVEFLRYRDLFDPLVEQPVYQPLLDEYLRWMRDHQHAVEGTLELRELSVARFLASLGEEATTEGLGRLDARRVESFFIEYAEGRARASRRSMQAALRTFLRFCFHEGYIRQCLDHAVPTLPTVLSQEKCKWLFDPMEWLLVVLVANSIWVADEVLIKCKWKLATLPDFSCFLWQLRQSKATRRPCLIFPSPLQ